MARKSNFVCQNCGNVTGKWAGRCEACSAWNSISEESESSGIGASPRGAKAGRGRQVPLESLRGDTDDAPRILSGIKELDRVTGGGFVPGSALLLRYDVSNGLVDVRDADVPSIDGSWMRRRARSSGPGRLRRILYR